MSKKIEEKLDRMIELLESVNDAILQFQQFVLEVTPDAAIGAVEALEEELSE